MRCKTVRYFKRWSLNLYFKSNLPDPETTREFSRKYLSKLRMSVWTATFVIINVPWMLKMSAHFEPLNIHESRFCLNENFVAENKGFQSLSRTLIPIFLSFFFLQRVWWDILVASNPVTRNSDISEIFRERPIFVSDELTLPRSWERVSRYISKVYFSEWQI